MKGYTNKTSIENYLLVSIDESFDDQIEAWIGSVEKIIDKMTGRNFIADEEASERVYDGDNTGILLIDDAIEITKVEVDGTEVTDDCYIYPANTLPKGKIRLSNGVFNRGMQNISVEAKWGYSEDVPDDIAFAATVMVAGIVNNSRGDGEVSSERIGNYQVSYSEGGIDDLKQSMDILNSYKKYAL